MVLMLSATGMVSAFEAHAINVTAHVENALVVDTPHVAYGTVFPEEWVVKKFNVTVSPSFCQPTQINHSKVYYRVYVQEKPGYLWLGDALYLGVDPPVASPLAADLTWVGLGASPVLMTMPDVNPDYDGDVTTQSLKKTSPGLDFLDTIVVALDTPVFKGYWNSLTDVNPKPSGKSGPTVVLEGARNVPSGIDLGVDLVIQVTGFGSPDADGGLCAPQ